ncbi:hypothetical protein GLAREA_06816 [Glarea lozoyensis ATCC 20868]|uniref:Uncharacterized protein n=1 Tax=Glarea lozoyensis (strain ATCC 20868 / MF5171) TaxID=1116229 RepID=S3E630_GLAL2|nr:uncharacterized protein GLAREA_06816 [Glarea lozoyensis ATCC 20868]EPE33803.1 hypothetical protein GLAREA_06816 [Glarea lozoyensis ATCC 20868]
MPTQTAGANRLADRQRRLAAKHHQLYMALELNALRDQVQKNGDKKAGMGNLDKREDVEKIRTEIAALEVEIEDLHEWIRRYGRDEDGWIYIYGS